MCSINTVPIVYQTLCYNCMRKKVNLKRYIFHTFKLCNLSKIFYLFLVPISRSQLFVVVFLVLAGGGGPPGLMQG